MPLLTQQNHDAILAAIEDINTMCSGTPGVLLTEGDLQCLFFRRLSSVEAFGAPVATQDHHILASPTHAEVSWFDDEGRLTIKPDITILDPAHLSLLHEVGSLKSPPSKGFHFTGNAFIFELKFARSRRGISEAVLKKIKKDFEKVERLFSKLADDGDADNVYCYLIIFSRYNIAVPAWNAFFEAKQTGPHWKIIYKSLNIDPFDNH